LAVATAWCRAFILASAPSMQAGDGLQGEEQQEAEGGGHGDCDY
jgi:hypothetical protein